MSTSQEAQISAVLESQDGVVAPRYRSGQRSAEALVEAGRALLKEISYEGLSISEICKQANLTTGAFYRRFESKDAFFLALQRLALDDIEQTTQALVEELEAQRQAPLSAHVLRIVNEMRAWHLRHCGVVRASIQRRDHTSGGWRPIKESGQHFVRAIGGFLAQLPELRKRKDIEARLHEVFQVVIGTLVNAALNDPGPLHLEDAAMTQTLAHIVTLYVE